MTSPIRRAVAWGPLVVAMVVGAVIVGVAVWRLQLQAVERRVEEKRSTIKKLVLSGKIPPNEEVMQYLTARQGALEQRYQNVLKQVVAAAPSEAIIGDPQVSFQQQLLGVQRTLERLAAARTMALPEQVGFPKELPPAETVPRLVAQLSLVQEAAGLIFQQDVEAVSSFKLEDPQTVPEPEATTPFLTRVPVRVRLTSSLAQLMKLLAALERATPIIDVRALRVISSTPERLEIELVLARYLSHAHQP